MRPGAQRRNFLPRMRNQDELGKGGKMIEVKVKFEYEGDREYPTLTNFGDILKSFQQVFNFYTTLQEDADKKVSLSIIATEGNPFVVTIQANWDVDEFKSTIKWMREIWSAVQEDDKPTVFSLLNINKKEFDKVFKQNPTLSDLSRLERLNIENIDTFKEMDPNIEIKLRTIQPITRAKRWKFQLV
jgi:hypothetical protein